jgi:CubicO group peptidase (beta-lactamase class C family)
MDRLPLSRRTFLALPLILAALAPSLPAQKAATYFPPPGQWQKKSPAEVGMDPRKLQQAIEYAQAHGSTWDFEKDQVRTFGTPLGPLPKQCAATNGIILRHGYIVAEFGDTKANDPVYSVAKSFLSTVCSLAVERGLIKDVNDPVAGTSTTAATMRRTMPGSPGRIISSRPANGRARCGVRTPIS